MKNMVFAGTAVVNGHAEGIVTNIGMNTEVGKIASMIITNEAPQTPIQKKLSEVGKVLGIACVVICALIFVIGVIKKISVVEMFMTSVGLAVAAIPEGLPEVAEGYERVYYVVRDHNGEIEVLNTTVNDDNTISFESDKFSTYALVYKDADVEGPTQPEKPVDTETPPQSETPDTSVDTDSPNTNGSALMGCYIVMMLLSICIIIVLKAKEIYSK